MLRYAEILVVLIPWLANRSQRRRSSGTVLGTVVGSAVEDPPLSAARLVARERKQIVCPRAVGIRSDVGSTNPRPDDPHARVTVAIADAGIAVLVGDEVHHHGAGACPCLSVEGIPPPHFSDVLVAFASDHVSGGHVDHVSLLALEDVASPRAGGRS
jgi:hypothetical protein